ncbi:MAG: hypothetical protein ACRD3G_23210 [Vicinamibacterales bacterium]
MYRGAPGVQEDRLLRILDFFGVPAAPVNVDAPDASPLADSGTFAVLGSVDAVAAGLTNPLSAAYLRQAAAIFGFAGDDRDAARRGVTELCGGDWTWTTPDRPVIEISTSDPEFTGVMSGLRVDGGASPSHAVLTPAAASAAAGIVLVDGRPGLFRVSVGNTPAYICSSVELPDLDAPVGTNYYDVRAHFLAAVPLVMFIASIFREVMWRPRELGACLIIDDPLLKHRYGFCDFPWLRDRMRERRFTTNIAFIPWNWRRTSQRASAFFRGESDLFSVSIHGCDHVAAEFGTTSLDVLGRRARLAQSRMQRHRARTRIAHDPVMVFPQGVFSAECPAVLKHNEFIAAVNTEISPVGAAAAHTRLRDVWDVAILRYGSFAIYTRRYERHGLENFAFDLLLGKPCFIVAHHDEFRDGARTLLSLIDRLQTLPCTLTWRSPADIVRRACRVRDGEDLQARMYGSQLLLTNPGTRPSVYHVHKLERQPASVSAVTVDGHDIAWSVAGEDIAFPCVVPARGEILVHVRYRDERSQQTSDSVKYQLSVAARRVLSEFRDEYVRKLQPAPTPVGVHERH